MLHPLFHTEPGGWIGKHYTRVEGLDKLIDEGRSTIDQARRKRTYAQIQKIIRDEAPAVYLFTAVRHPGHQQEGGVRGPRRRVALALRRQAEEVAPALP